MFTSGNPSIAGCHTTISTDIDSVRPGTSSLLSIDVDVTVGSNSMAAVPIMYSVHV